MYYELKIKKKIFFKYNNERQKIFFKNNNERIFFVLIDCCLIKIFTKVCYNNNLFDINYRLLYCRARV